MTSKQRFIQAINHKKPDHPPVFATCTPQVAEKMSTHLRLPYEEPMDSLLSTRISHMDLLTRLGNDAVGIAACAPTDNPTTTDNDGIITNEWGMQFKPKGLYNEFCAYPLEKATSPEDIKNYPFPLVNAPGRFEAAKATIEKYGNNYAVIGDLECAIFETAWYLTGLEKFMMDMAMDMPYLNVLLDKILEINTETGLEMIKMGTDMIWAGDDFGSQNGMIMHPDTWRKVFKPRIKIMFDAFKKENPKIKIAWHSCGSIIPIIPDFIEIGLDILNPIQPLATGMEPEFLKKEYGKDLIFFGGIDVQHLLPYETPDRVKSEVKRIAHILGEGGGYIIAPAHNVQDDTSVENVLAFFEAIKSL